MSERFQAFFSYATADWDSATDGEAVQYIVNALEQETNRELMNADFTLWQDRKRLRWGDGWRDKLVKTVNDSHLFIALVSHSWLCSDYCALEYRTFRDRVPPLPSDGRILPILLTEISEDDKAHMTDKQGALYAELRAIQTERWPDLPSLKKAGQKKILRQCSNEVKARIAELRNVPSQVQSTTIQRVEQPEPAAHRPVDGNIIPQVSGDYHVPSQGAGSCTLRLAVAGLSEVETEHGSITFAITGLTIQTTIAGGRIIDENPDFATGWDGPIARVTRVQTGPTQSALAVEAKDNRLPRGEPLVAKGEAGHVRLFDIERQLDTPLSVSGAVTIAKRAIDLVDIEDDLSPDAIAQRREIKKKLIDILISKYLDERCGLESWSDD